MKVILVKYRYDDSKHCWYYCPGCNIAHAFSLDVHQWNGDRNNPTVSPSLLHSNPQQHQICHSFIKDGKIQFCGDSWHDLKGQTVDLPELDHSSADKLGFDMNLIEILIDSL